MKSYIYYILLIAFSITFIQCQQDDGGVFQLIDTTRYTINDKNNLLSRITEISYINSDTAIVNDNTKTLRILDDYKTTARVGQKGEGPCEYESPLSYTFNNNKVYILDDSKSSILVYSLRKKRCLYEISNEKIYGMQGIEVYQDKIFLIRGGIMSSTSPDENILYSINKNGVIDTIGLRKNELDGTFIRAPIRKHIPTSRYNGGIYFHMPMGSNLWFYSVRSDTIGSFEIGKRYLGDRDLSNIQDISKIIEIINEDVDQVIDVNATDQYVVSISRLGTPPDDTWNLRFFDHDGKEIDLLQFNEYIVDINESIIRTLKITQNEQNPYSIYEYRYE